MDAESLSDNPRPIKKEFTATQNSSPVSRVISLKVPYGGAAFSQEKSHYYT